MINFENVTGGNTQEHNPRWLQIPDHPYSILIIGLVQVKRMHGSFLNFTNQMLSFLYVKDLF